VNEALLYAWNNGVLHCDLTPGNIRLNEFGQFILVDFGLASASLSPRQAVLSPTAIPRPGTPLYMSPERILGEHVDIRSDLYALGAILSELLTGETLFRGNDIEQIERNHLAPSRSLIHPTLARYAGIEPVLRSLLARWPSERYADPVVLQQALRTLASYPPSVSVRPQIDTEQQIPSLRRRLSAC